jgi:DNA-binding NarL/FixJ family response regulator
METGKKITILIVDDHAVVRQGIQTFLETNPDLEVTAQQSAGRRRWRWPPDASQTWPWSI